MAVLAALGPKSRRPWRWRAGAFLETLWFATRWSVSPWVLPPVAIRLALLLAFGTRGPLRGDGCSPISASASCSRWRRAALASAVVHLPLAGAGRPCFPWKGPTGGGRGRQDARRSSLGQAPQPHAALAWPGPLSGAITAFAASVRRIRGHLTFASQHPRARPRPCRSPSMPRCRAGRREEAARLCALSILLALVAVTAGELVNAARNGNHRAMSRSRDQRAARRFRARGLIHGEGRGDGAVGPSGSGKSSIVNAIAGLLRPRQGRIRGERTRACREPDAAFRAGEARRIAVVFQDARLFPHMSVEDNLLFGWRRSAAKMDAGASPMSWISWVSARC